MNESSRPVTDITALVDRELAKWNDEDVNRLLSGKKGEARARLMTLSAAVVGLVAPLLALNTNFANLKLVKVSCSFLLFSIGIGAFAEVAERFQMKGLIVVTFKRNTARLAALLRSYGVRQLDSSPIPDPKIVEEEYSAALARSVKWLVAFTVSFYATFILGLVLLIAALHF